MIKNGLMFKKFAFIIVCCSLLPMLLLSTIVINKVFSLYEKSEKASYEKTVNNVISNITNVLDYYDQLSKILYNNGGIDQIKPPYDKLDNDIMESMLKNIQYMDSNVRGVLFCVKNLSDKDKVYAYSFHNTYFQYNKFSEFKNIINISRLKMNSRELMLIEPHENDYFYGEKKKVFTIVRNYFDPSEAIYSNSYIGSLFIDIDTSTIWNICKEMEFGGRNQVYVYNNLGFCFYSSDISYVGTNLYHKRVKLESGDGNYAYTSEENDYGLKMTVLSDSNEVFHELTKLQELMYVILIIAFLSLIAASVISSRRLTRPIYNMISQMSLIESGNFKIKLPVEANDEIGILSKRFNQMSYELEKYINKYYVALIKQKEAEMTSLKSQIYPHFLYNTLEVIRMTAITENDDKVSNMIEALSSQIHYIIGNTNDMVPLELEADIVKKYIYLLNCRNVENMTININLGEFSKVLVPKLILQPIVENSYIHGIKGKKQDGSIMIETVKKKEQIEIIVMDDGIGMSDDTLNQLKEFLESDEIGVKNEYNWQSIGLKNVNDRIKSLYGMEYGIQITSTISIGTMVRILIPVDEQCETKV